MMDALNALKSSCRNDNDKWDNLPIGKYKVKYFKINNTEYGQKLFVYLDNKMILQLPPRFFKNINQDNQVEELNKKKLVMTFDGKDSQRHNFLQIDFDEEEEIEKQVQIPKRKTTKKKVSDESETEDEEQPKRKKIPKKKFAIDESDDEEEADLVKRKKPKKK